MKIIKIIQFQNTSLFRIDRLQLFGIYMSIVDSDLGLVMRYIIYEI